jgi:hypothetical protein
LDQNLYSFLKSSIGLSCKVHWREENAKLILITGGKCGFCRNVDLENIISASPSAAFSAHNTDDTEWP